MRTESDCLQYGIERFRSVQLDGNYSGPKRLPPLQNLGSPLTEVSLFGD